MSFFAKYWGNAGYTLYGIISVECLTLALVLYWNNVLMKYKLI